MHTATVTPPPRAPRDALRAQLHTNTFLYAVWGGGGIFLYAFWGFSLMGLTNCSVSNSVSHFLQRNYILRGAA